MLKPPHPVARAAYALAMTINPNNHARDGGRASSAMEIEAVSAIAAMFGWTAPNYLGHLTSSGTMANLEALWVAGQTAPGKSDCGLRAGPLHPPAHLRRAEAARTPAVASRLPRPAIASMPSKPSSARATWERWSSPWAPPPSAPSIRWTRCWNSREIRLPRPRRRRIRRLLQAHSRFARRAGPPGFRSRSTRPTPSSSIPTSTASSPTAAAACCSATREWAVSTSTTRPTHISLPTSCTWAKSAWSVPAPGPPPLPSGLPRGCCRLCPAASSPAGWRKAAPPPWNWTADCARTPAFEPLAAGRPELDIVVWKLGRRHSAKGIGTRPENL